MDEEMNQPEVGEITVDDSEASRRRRLQNLGVNVPSEGMMQ